MNNPQEDTYVGFSDPVSLRKPLLEAAHASLSTARIQGKIQHIQDQKLAVRSDLSKTLRDLRDELAKLQMILPHREIKEAPASVAPVVKKKVIDHRVDKIESALAEIEQKLRSL